MLVKFIFESSDKQYEMEINEKDSIQDQEREYLKKNFSKLLGESVSLFHLYNPLTSMFVLVPNDLKTSICLPLINV